MAATFSYAQAAKGDGSTPSTPVNAPSQAAESQAGSSVDDTPATSLDNSQPVRSSNIDKLDLESTIGSEADSVQAQTRPERELSRLERPWRRTEKSPANRSDDQDSRRRKGKKSRGDKSSEQAEKVEQPKVELSEAPIPTFNPWMQKKEAPAPPKEQPTPAAPPAEVVRKTTRSNSDLFANGIKFTRKPVVDANAIAAPPAPAPTNATANPAAQRNGSRGSRNTDKDTKPELVSPAAADPALWPTVETAAQQEEKKKSADKSERFEKESQAEDGAPSKPRQKEKWVTYEYVPTVNFETQLPQMRNSKPRGGARNVNGSRATTGSQSGDKTNASAAPNKAISGDRNRRESANGTTRTASLPPNSKRASMEVNQARDQRKVSGTVSEKGKDAPANQTQEQSQPPRERQDGRTDRGRGGFRGRGGHHTLGGQSQHHVAGGFTSNNLGNRPQAPYSPSARQGVHGQVFVPGAQRGRGRNNAANNYHRMSLPNGVPRLAPLQQTQFGHYEYPLPPMTAIPYQPTPYAAGWDHMLLPVLKNQIEYYFSIENLCKDMYLRARMDSQGFVPLHFIAAFKRVRELSADMGMIRAVCESSTEIDFVVGEDDMDRVRRREGWETWVLPLQDRDELARSHGPARVTFKNRSYNMGHMINGLPNGYYGQIPAPFVPQGDQVQQYAEYPPQYGTNGIVNGDGQYKGSTPLSANVPDFAPSAPVVNGSSDEQTNGVHPETVQ